MKEKIWNLLVTLTRIVPSGLRKLICRLCFAAEEKGNTRQGLLNLIELNDQCHYHLDQMAIRDNNGVHPKHELMSYHDFFINHLKPGQSVLDVGCGIGAVSWSMAEAGLHVTGVDFEQKHIEIARNKHSHDRITYIYGDVTKDLPEGHYDAIVMSNVLEHIDDRVGLLKALNNRFTPGKILIRVPMVNRDWLVPLKKRLGLSYYCDPTHFTEYTEESFREEMQQAGLITSELTVIWGEVWAEVKSGA
jgi:2-polyprenyl-3-methyl-5-hydroxy-6-metoxy-1,4-benzoquinol methylase